MSYSKDSAVYSAIFSIDKSLSVGSIETFESTLIGYVLEITSFVSTLFDEVIVIGLSVFLIAAMFAPDVYGPQFGRGGD